MVYYREEGCAHCGGQESSMFRPSQVIPGRDVCRGRGCWHTEGWLPELKKRGRPASAVADGHELAVQSFISLILQIEGQILPL